MCSDVAPLTAAPPPLAYPLYPLMPGYGGGASVMYTEFAEKGKKVENMSH